MIDKIILDTLGAYNNRLYANISKSDLPVGFKAKFIEMSLKTKWEVLKVLRERLEEEE